MKRLVAVTALSFCTKQIAIPTQTPDTTVSRADAEWIETARVRIYSAWRYDDATLLRLGLAPVA